MPKLDLKLPSITGVVRQTVAIVTQTYSFQNLKTGDMLKKLSRFAMAARSRRIVLITRLRTMKSMEIGRAHV